MEAADYPIVKFARELKKKYSRINNDGFSKIYE